MKSLTICLASRSTMLALFLVKWLGPSEAVVFQKHLWGTRNKYLDVIITGYGLSHSPMEALTLISSKYRAGLFCFTSLAHFLSSSVLLIIYGWAHLVTSMQLQWGPSTFLKLENSPFFINNRKFKFTGPRFAEG